MRFFCIDIDRTCLLYVPLLLLFLPSAVKQESTFWRLAVHPGYDMSPGCAVGWAMTIENRLSLWPLLELCHNALTPAETPGRHETVVMCSINCYVGRVFSRGYRSSLQNSVHPAEVAINPPKTAYGCPCVARWYDSVAVSDTLCFGS